MDSNSGNLKRYVVGPVAKLQETFPGYSADNIRSSLDGKLAIYEVNLTQDAITTLKLIRSLKAYTHEEVLALLSAAENAGIWYAAEAANDAP